TLAIARFRNGVDAATALAVILALLLGIPELLIGTSSVALLIAGPRAWVRAVEHHQGRPHVLVLGPSLLALMLAYVVSLLRGQRVVLVRGASLWFAGVLASTLIVRNNDLDPVVDTATVLLATLLATLLVALVLALPLEQVARHSDDVLVMGGAPRWLRGLATRMTLLITGGTLGSASVGVTLALTGSGSAAAGSWARALAVLLAAFGAGAAVGTLAAVLAARSSDTGRRTPGRAVVGALALVAAIVSAMGLSPLLAAAALGLLALVLGFGSQARFRGRQGIPDTSRRRQEAMLDVVKIRKRLGGRSILNGVSLTCRAGEILVVTGNNGAGKSTLLRTIAGLLAADRGDVVICGHRMATAGVAARRCLGYVPDGHDAFPDLLVGEYVTLVAALKGARLAGDTDQHRTLGVDAIWHQRLGTLSLGQRKRTGLCCALLGDPRLLVLDEPSNGLDSSGVDQLLALVRCRSQRGLAAVVATNDEPFEQTLLGGGATTTGHHLRLSNGTVHAA
ncbi:ATP-binding cassette domain-containing protein, partial [Myxococcota bacterium]